MTDLLSAAQMKAIETAAIEAGAVTGLELMERAGRGVVAAVFAEWPELQAAPHRAVVLCGPGNNGGDGFVVARLLREWGWVVEVFLFGDPAKLPPDAKANHARWVSMGAVAPLPEQGLPIGPGTALVVDALFGTGLARPVGGKTLGRALQDIADCIAIGAGRPVSERAGAGAPVAVAVDIPSGLCADSGRVLDGGVDAAQGSRSACAGADLTVSFHSEKLGHRLAEGPAICGKTVVKDIGLPPAAPGGAVRLAAAPRAGAVVKDGGHKYGHGHAVVVAGPMGRTGAARLAARGALRVGAGLVTVAAPGAAMMECAAQLTAIMLRRADDAAGLAALLEDDRLNAVCLGPGLGVSPDTRDQVAVALSDGSGRRGVVLDADALTSFAEDPSAVFEALHDRCVLTPHGGEFARLFPDIAEKLNAPATKGPAFSKVDATREAAARAGCVVLFKGPDTVIAAPDGRCSINSAHYERAAPWLATAGAGDVLSGFITGLLARGLEPMQAAETAAWLHVEAARSFGPGLIAEDLPEALPGVLRALLG